MVESPEDFVRADNRNLPDVNILMLLEYLLESNNYSSAEIRIAKDLLRSREIYLDTAIGYVNLKREDDICTVKCKLMSEHTVEKKQYDVTAVINESTETIVKIKCKECGGCRHTIYFALWLIKRSGESQNEEYVSYWNAPILDEVEKCGGFLTAKQLGEPYEDSNDSDMESLPEADPSIFKGFLEECKKRNIKTMFTEHFANRKSSNDET